MQRMRALAWPLPMSRTPVWGPSKSAMVPMVINLDFLSM
ncbi:MAG: hypothetical protein CM1200mP22_11790 [Dehalococcoidia bacterium]|nr:MAG: hypothetical protein CM1200mP22_11790 [Dehalococcoidia bacterium]